jgi:rare lipoprotein A (peptidoglycan hydrolase)
VFAEVVLTATVYASQLRGGVMANGGRYDPSKSTVAMNGRPLNSEVTVCHGSRCAPATVTDRMSSRYGRKARRVDLSAALARRLGIKGKAQVVVRGP